MPAIPSRERAQRISLVPTSLSEILELQSTTHTTHPLPLAFST